MSKEKQEKLGSFASKEWQDWFLSCMDEESKEYVENENGIFPRAIGLLRAIERNIGHVDQAITVNKCASIDDVSSTVAVSITIQVRDHIYQIWSNMPTDLVSVGVADAGLLNTKAPYGNHAAATAHTRALGRALKLALCLDIHTVEEMGIEPNFDKAKDNTGIASSTKRRSIQNMMDKLKVSEEIFKEYSIESLGSPSLMAHTAQTLLEKLNEYQNGLEIPKEYIK